MTRTDLLRLTKALAIGIVGGALFFALKMPLAWMMGFDLYPLTTLEEKKKWISEAVKNEWLCLFAHDPEVPAAYLRERDGRVMAEPVREPELVTT